MKRFLSCLLALLMLLATASAENWDSLDVLACFYPVGQADGDAFLQKVDVSRQEGNVRISQCELGYDGRVLISRYAIRRMDATAPMGEMDETLGLRLLTWEEAAAFDELGYGNGETGFWTDNFWINGQCIGMPMLSSNYVNGSETPGEIVHTDIWRLDLIGVELAGETEVTLPIGARPARETYAPRAEHPDKYDQNGDMLPPATGTLTATFDAGNGNLDREYACNVQTALEALTAQGATVAVSPLMTYIELRITANDEDAAYSYLRRCEVADGSGKLLFPGQTMMEGMDPPDETGVQTVHYLCPRLTDVKGPLYLVHVAKDGTVDMAQALLILE